MDNNLKIWELLKLIIVWVHEYQANRLLEEAEWFGIQTNSDLLFFDLLNYTSDEGLNNFLDKNGLGLTIENIREFEKVSADLENMAGLNEQWSEKAYTVAVGMLKAMLEE